MNKKYIGFWYLLLVYSFVFIFFLSTRHIDLRSANWIVVMAVVYVITRLGIKPMVCWKEDAEGPKWLRFIPVAQEYILLSNTVVKVTYIVAYVLAVLMAFLAYGIPDTFFSIIGVVGMSMNPWMLRMTNIAIVCLVVTKVCVAISLIPAMWENMTPMNNTGVHKGASMFMKVLSAVLLFIPLVRNFAMAYIAVAQD